MKLVFMGTPDFAAVCLKKLIESDNEVALVVTQPDKAKDRGKKIKYTPVKELALRRDIRVIQPEKLRGNEEVIRELSAIQPDIIVVAAYGQILPREILELPGYGCINVHASLLPKLRGAAPIQRAIIDGETVTGVTIMQMEEGLDTGAMLSRLSVDIGDKNYEELHNSLAEAGSELLTDTLRLIERGEIMPEPQNESLATYAERIYKEDGHIDFKKSPVEIERLIRAFDPWPGAYAVYSDKGETMKFWRAEPTDEPALCGRRGENRGDAECGEVPENAENSEDGGTAGYGEIIKVNDNNFIVKCSGGNLKVSEIQVAGKKRCKVGDYLRGNVLKTGRIFR